jgi:hypothetical protein
MLTSAARGDFVSADLGNKFDKKDINMPAATVALFASSSAVEEDGTEVKNQDVRLNKVARDADGVTTLYTGLPVARATHDGDPVVIRDEEVQAYRNKDELAKPSAANSILSWQILSESSGRPGPFFFGTAIAERTRIEARATGPAGALGSAAGAAFDPFTFTSLSPLAFAPARTPSSSSTPAAPAGLTPSRRTAPSSPTPPTPPHWSTPTPAKPFGSSPLTRLPPACPPTSPSILSPWAKSPSRPPTSSPARGTKPG